MHAIRQSVAMSRRVFPRVNAVRMYSDVPDGSAGATARSTGWSKREKAQEDQYIIEEEKRKLKERAYLLTQCVKTSRSSPSSSRTCVHR